MGRAASVLRWRGNLEEPGRYVVALVGGYFAAAATVSCLALGLILALGMQRGDAVVLSTMLGFLVYLAILLWALVARRGLIVLAVLLVWIVAGNQLAAVLSETVLNEQVAA